MGDDNFERALVLICLHDDEQAMGVIVNDPLPEPDLFEVLAQLDCDPHPDLRGEPVYCGGPVQRERGLVVHTLDYQRDETLRITEKIGLTSTQTILKDIASRRQRAAPSAYFLAVGYAGWGAGQLEQEVAMNVWSDCGADPDLIFAGDKQEAWAAAFESIGVTRAKFSREWAPREGGPLH